MKTYEHNGVKLRRVKVEHPICVGCYLRDKMDCKFDGEIECMDDDGQYIFKPIDEVTTHDLREIDRAEGEYAT